jgi:hypothetical protein
LQLAHQSTRSVDQRDRSRSGGWVKRRRLFVGCAECIQDVQQLVLELRLSVLADGG